jgi:hypothetical protein
METLTVIALADLPLPSPCCLRAHEQGYRRGYRDGYTYAVWDLGRVVRIAERLGDQVEQFLDTTLAPWVHRARQQDGTVRREGGPRLCLDRQETS